MKAQGVWQTSQGGAGFSEVRVLLYVVMTFTRLTVCLSAHTFSTGVCGEPGVGVGGDVNHLAHPGSSQSG